LWVEINRENKVLKIYEQQQALTSIGNKMVDMGEGFGYSAGDENRYDIQLVDGDANRFLIKKKPEPTETEIMGQQLVEKDIQVLELQTENQLLGQQIVDIDLRLLMGGI